MKKITETRKRNRNKNRNRKRKRQRETRKKILKNKAGMLSNSYADKTQPIVMRPIILFKSQNYKDGYYTTIMELMHNNKTFVRVPGNIDDLWQSSVASRFNPGGLPCTYASLLIPGWYETYRQGIAGLYVRYKDDAINLDDNLGIECGLQNYIWPCDALGQIMGGVLSVTPYNAFIDLYTQGIAISSFMEYIYNSDNKILTDDEKEKYIEFYTNRHLHTAEFLDNYLRIPETKIKLSELVRTCFKTYSQLVTFVTSIERKKNSFFGDTKLEHGDTISIQDAQRLCMSKYYTETLLPEDRKLVGLYVSSINRKYYTEDEYDTFIRQAIEIARGHNIPLFSLVE
jgi:hypothetical protein